MKLSDVPMHPAYVVFHDCFSNGAMEVWPARSLEMAQMVVTRKQELADKNGNETAIWRAYVTLPRKRIYKYHSILLP